MISVIFAFLFVDLFDNTGTLIGVAKRAGLMGADGHLPKMGRALIADSTAAMGGSLLGTSTTTSYIESACGCGCWRPHRPDRLRGGRAVPAGAVLRTAGRHRAAHLPPHRHLLFMSPY